MNPFFRTANSSSIQELTERFFELSEVQGIAVGVFSNFIRLFRNEFNETLSVSQIIDDKRIPERWPEICNTAGFPVVLSPIYVVIYVTEDQTAFRRRYDVPTIVGENHAVFVETTAPFRAMADRGRHSGMCQ